MCRRSGGSVCLALIFTLYTLAAQAQEALPASVITLIEQLAGEGSDAETLMHYYEGLMDRPLNLNACSRAMLEETGLLTLFQVESILAWRERYGAIRSFTEWSLVEGFSKESVEGLQPFFVLGEPSQLQPPSTTLTARFKKKWKQEGFSVTAKALYERTDISAGVVTDNDPGERFPDFISVHARWKGLYAGDFTARFGQGLVLWKAFNMSAFGTPSTLARRGNGLQCHRSTDESNFLRGVAATHDFGRLGVCALVSYNALDARIVDGSYTSIYTDGIHATEAERARRHSMHETVAGVHLSYTVGSWRLGVTAAGYGYDKPNGRRVYEYNLPQQYDGAWGNLGFDWYGSLGSLRIYGEAALDRHRAPAVIAGAVWSPDYSFEAGVQARCYSPSYIATHAGAWSTVSTVSNQIGATAALQWIRGGWTLRLNADICYYPWKRYRAEAGTSTFKGRVQLLRSFRSGATVEGQFSWGSRMKCRLGASVPIGDNLTLEARGDATPGGVAGYVGARWKPSRSWTVSARATLWHTDGWDSRLAFYEQGVPQSFPVETLSGKGKGAYLVVKYAPSKRFDCCLKLQQGYCAYFVRIFIPGRSTLLAFMPLSL